MFKNILQTVLELRVAPLIPLNLIHSWTLPWRKGPPLALTAPSEILGKIQIEEGTQKVKNDFKMPYSALANLELEQPK
jgi:hypothetical protein